MRARNLVLLAFPFIVLQAGCADAMYDPNLVTEPHATVTGTLLRSHESFVTKQVLRFKVEFKYNGWPMYYDVLLGPFPNVIPAPDAVCHYQNTAPGVYLQSGWVYLSGDYPLGETNLVWACAEGTTLIVQIDAGVHRVYMLRESRLGHDTATVKLKPALTIVRTWESDADKYVETISGGTDLSAVLPVATAPQAIQDFVAYVRQQAAMGNVHGP